MCWQVGAWGDNAAQRAVNQIRKHESHNGHSWGFAWVDDSGNLMLSRGVGKIPDAVNIPNANIAVAHTRYATRGLVNTSNAHPIPVEVDGEMQAVLCHNGTWYEAPKETYKSDSRYLAQLLGEIAENTESMGDAVAQLGFETDQSVIVLTKDSEIFAHRGKFNLGWSEKDQFVQSTGYPDMERGAIFELAQWKKECSTQ